jgi:hypothetical protein
MALHNPSLTYYTRWCGHNMEHFLISHIIDNCHDLSFEGFRHEREMSFGIQTHFHKYGIVHGSDLKHFKWNFILKFVIS